MRQPRPSSIVNTNAQLLAALTRSETLQTYARANTEMADQPVTLRAYFARPIVAQRKLDAVSHLLAIFADHLAMSSNRFKVQAANTELPVIAPDR